MLKPAEWCFSDGHGGQGAKPPEKRINFKGLRPLDPYRGCDMLKSLQLLAKSDFKFSEGNVSQTEIVNFTQQLATMVDAGIPVVRAMAALDNKSGSKAFQTLLRELKKDIETGMPLSVAFAKHDKVFSAFYTSILYASEQGVALGEALTRIVVQLEQEVQTRAKLKQVFTYPMVMGGFCLLIVTFIILFIAPVFAKVYGQMGVTLPLPTRILLGLSDLVRGYWHVGSVVIGLGVFFLRKKITKDDVARMVLRLPVIGPLAQKVAIARFIRTFSTMMSCHVPLLTALDVTQKVVGNAQITDVITHIRNNVQTGKTISDSLKQSGLFSPVIIQMAYIGEESGRMGPLFEKCATAIEAEVAESSKKTMSLLEPIMTVGLSAVIGFIAMAIYMPMFDIMGHVGK
jgi:type IV pilus assembly protein PilC